jgi:polyhydroxyalkanoate synthesis regulator phasin
MPQQKPNVEIRHSFRIIANVRLFRGVVKLLVEKGVLSKDEVQGMAQEMRRELTAERDRKVAETLPTIPEDAQKEAKQIAANFRSLMDDAFDAFDEAIEQI